MQKVCLVFLSLVVINCVQNNELTPDEQKIADTFVHYSDFVTLVEEAKSFELYEGLPHQLLDQELYESEKASQATVVIEDYDFYSEPVSMTHSEREKLVEMFATKKYFTEYAGTKACGGFHPDFAMDMAVDGQQVVVQFCFGCSEVRAINGGVEMYCEMTDKGMTELKSFFEDFRNKRPEGHANYWK